MTRGANNKRWGAGSKEKVYWVRNRPKCTWVVED